MFEVLCQSPFTSVISFYFPNYLERLAGQKYHPQGQIQNPSGMNCLAQGHGA